MFELSAVPNHAGEPPTIEQLESAMKKIEQNNLRILLKARCMVFISKNFKVPVLWNPSKSRKLEPEEALNIFEELVKPKGLKND